MRWARTGLDACPLPNSRSRPYCAGTLTRGCFRSGCGCRDLHCHACPKVGSPLLDSKPVVRLTPRENLLLFTRWSAHDSKRVLDKTQHCRNIERTRRQRADLVGPLNVLWRSSPKFLAANKWRRTSNIINNISPDLACPAFEDDLSSLMTPPCRIQSRKCSCANLR